MNKPDAAKGESMATGDKRCDTCGEPIALGLGIEPNEWYHIDDDNSAGCTRDGYPKPAKPSLSPEMKQLIGPLRQAAEEAYYYRLPKKLLYESENILKLLDHIEGKR
jgi:hypothetical protein